MFLRLLKHQKDRKIYRLLLWNSILQLTIPKQVDSKASWDKTNIYMYKSLKVPEMIHERKKYGCRFLSCTIIVFSKWYIFFLWNFCLLSILFSFFFYSELLVPWIYLLERGREGGLSRLFLFVRVKMYTYTMIYLQCYIWIWWCLKFNRQMR